MSTPPDRAPIPGIEVPHQTRHNSKLPVWVVVGGLIGMIAVGWWAHSSSEKRKEAERERLLRATAEKAQHELFNVYLFRGNSPVGRWWHVSVLENDAFTGAATLRLPSGAETTFTVREERNERLFVIPTEGTPVDPVAVQEALGAVKVINKYEQKDPH
jgi:hypothetical protein